MKSEAYDSGLGLKNLQVDASAISRGIYNKYADRQVALQTVVATDLLLLTKIERLVTGETITKRGILDKLKNAVEAGQEFTNFLTTGLGIDLSRTANREGDFSLAKQVYDGAMRAYRNRFSELALRSEIDWNNLGRDWSGSIGYEELKAGMLFVDKFTNLMRTSISSAEYISGVQQLIQDSTMASMLFDMYNRRRESSPYTLSVPGELVVASADFGGLIVSRTDDDENSGIPRRRFESTELSFYDVMVFLEDFSEEFVFGNAKQELKDRDALDLIRKNPSILVHGIDLIKFNMPTESVLVSRIDRVIRQFSVDWYVDLIVSPRVVSRERLEYMKIEDGGVTLIHNMATRISRDIIDLIQGVYTTFLNMLGEWQRVPELNVDKWCLGLQHFKDFHESMFKYKPSDVSTLFSNIKSRYESRANSRANALGEMFTSLLGPVSFYDPKFVNTTPLSDEVISDIEYELAVSPWSQEMMSGMRYKGVINTSSNYLKHLSVDNYRTYPNRLVSLSNAAAVNRMFEGSDFFSGVKPVTYAELKISAYKSLYNDVGELITSLFISPLPTGSEIYRTEKLYVSDDFVRLYSPQAMNAVLPRVSATTHIFNGKQEVQMLDALGLRGLEMFENAIRSTIQKMYDRYSMTENDMFIVGRFDGAVAIELFDMNIYTPGETALGYEGISANGHFYVPPHDIQRIIGNELIPVRYYLFTDTSTVTQVKFAPNVEFSKRNFKTEGKGKSSGKKGGKQDKASEQMPKTGGSTTDDSGDLETEK